MQVNPGPTIQKLVLFLRFLVKEGKKYVFCQSDECDYIWRNFAKMLNVFGNYYRVNLIKFEIVLNQLWLNLFDNGQIFIVENGQIF